MELEAVPHMSTNLILIFTSIILFLWYCSQDKFNYWSKRNVPRISLAKCCLQFLHHTFGQKHFFSIFIDHYAELEGHKYGGSFMLTQPILILRDPAIIKELLIKGFPSFHDRGPKRDEESDRLAGNLFQLTGHKWQLLRNKMSPAFSSAKIKIMYETLRECSREVDTYLREICGEAGETELNVKDLMTSYTMNVIGACALGINCNAIQDPSCEFKKVAETIFKLDLRRTVYVLLELIHPKLPGLFRLKAVDPCVERFLLAVCKDAMELKTEKTSIRKDFLQILMESESSDGENTTANTRKLAGEFDTSENGEGFNFTTQIMASIISGFLSAGFEPVSSTLTFCFYHLALNPEVQQKIWEEIQTVKKEVRGSISYENLKEFNYTEQVIKETLRMYPPGAVLRRNCTEPFAMPCSSLVIEKNVRLFIPAYNIHRDSKYFPDPNKFNPDRFSDENIDKIVSGSYFPFGIGPRSCIARRFAMMNVKIMVIAMVSNYALHTCGRTQKSIVFDTEIFTLCPKGGVWLRIQKRE